MLLLLIMHCKSAAGTICIVAKRSRKEAQSLQYTYIHTYIGSQPERVRHSSMALSLSLFLSSRHLNEVGASCHTSLAIATAAAAADYARGPAKAINMQRKTTTNTICCTTITTTTIIMNIRKFVRQLMANWNKAIKYVHAPLSMPSLHCTLYTLHSPHLSLVI